VALRPTLADGLPLATTAQIRKDTSGLATGASLATVIAMDARRHSSQVTALTNRRQRDIAAARVADER